MTARCFLLSPTTMAWLDSANDKLEQKTSSWIHVDLDYISLIADSALL